MDCPPDKKAEESFSIPEDQALSKAGWTRRHLADETRAKEAAELYGSMGFEVMEHKLSPENFADKCTGCASTVCDSYVVIYTRKKGAGEDQ